MAMEKKYVLEFRYPKSYLPPDLNKEQLIMPIGLRWNDLPEDIFREIMVRLCFADRIRLASCCKRLWSLIPKSETDQFPWVVKLNFRISTNKSILFQLFHPSHQKPDSITCVPEKFTGDRMTPLCCRNGWILLLGRRRKQILPGKLPRLSWSVVLVSPFTKQIIALPDFDHTSFSSDPLRCVKASFSSNPLSPDCVYLILWEISWDNRKARFSAFRNGGDSEWNTSEFSVPLYSFASVVYHEGSFYCVSGGGYIVWNNIAAYGIAAYNIIENKWRYFDGPKLGNRHGDCSRWLCLLVCEGKLVLVVVDVPFSEKITDQEERCIVYEYVEHNGNWVEKKSLGDNTFYLSRIGSFSVSASSPDMANRIYYVKPRGVEKKYYSFKDDKACLCESSCWPGVKRQGTWIEPPQLGK